MTSFPFENLLSKASQYFVQTSCEDLLVIKQDDQKFRQFHEIAKLKTQNKKSTPYIYFINLLRKKYLTIEPKDMFSIFLLSFIVHISFMLIFYYFYREIFNPRQNSKFFPISLNHKEVREDTSKLNKT